MKYKNFLTCIMAGTMLMNGMTVSATEENLNDIQSLSDIPREEWNYASKEVGDTSDLSVEEQRRLGCYSVFDHLSEQEPTLSDDFIELCKRYNDQQDELFNAYIGGMSEEGMEKTKIKLLEDYQKFTSIDEYEKAKGYEVTEFDETVNDWVETYKNYSSTDWEKEKFNDWGFYDDYGESYVSGITYRLNQDTADNKNNIIDEIRFSVDFSKGYSWDDIYIGNDFNPEMFQVYLTAENTSNDTIYDEDITEYVQENGKIIPSKIFLLNQGKIVNKWSDKGRNLVVAFYMPPFDPDIFKAPVAAVDYIYGTYTAEWNENSKNRISYVATEYYPSEKPIPVVVEEPEEETLVTIENESTPIGNPPFELLIPPVLAALLFILWKCRRIKIHGALVEINDKTFKVVSSRDKQKRNIGEINTIQEIIDNLKSDSRDSYCNYYDDVFGSGYYTYIPKRTVITISNGTDMISFKANEDKYLKYVANAYENRNTIYVQFSDAKTKMTTELKFDFSN